MRSRNNSHGFTMIELLLALMIGALAAGMIFTTFSQVSRAWRRSNELAEDLHHGDYVLDQLVLGLRSTYYPDTREGGYGFIFVDGGEGSEARDTISWFKEGLALVPSNSNPHRIKFGIEEDDEGETGAAVRYWEPYLMPEDFDFEVDTVPDFIASRVQGFNCRIATNWTEEGWEWEEEWEDEATNRLPRAVELTVYLTPIEEDADPYEMKRAIVLEVAELAWMKPISHLSGSAKAAATAGTNSAVSTRSSRRPGRSTRYVRPVSPVGGGGNSRGGSPGVFRGRGEKSGGATRPRGAGSRITPKTP